MVDSNELLFSTDGPLFVKKTNEFDSEINLLIDYFKSICKTMTQFTQDIQKASKTCQILQDEMKNGLVGYKTHSKIYNMMQTVSEVFNEISSSQDILSVSLVESFVKPLEEFCSNEVSKLVSCQVQYRKEKATSEEATLKYLQCDIRRPLLLSGRDGYIQHYTDLKAYDHVQHKKKLELSRYDMVANINELCIKKNFEVAETCVATLIVLRNHYHYISEKLVSCDKYILNLNKQQQDERNNYDARVSTIASTRAALQVSLDQIVNRVKVRIPQSFLEERDKQAQLTADRLDQVVAISGTVLNPEDVERVTSVASSALYKFSTFSNNLLGTLGVAMKGSTASTDSQLKTHSPAPELTGSTKFSGPVPGIIDLAERSGAGVGDKGSIVQGVASELNSSNISTSGVTNVFRDVVDVEESIHALAKPNFLYSDTTDSLLPDINKQVRHHLLVWFYLLVCLLIRVDYTRGIYG